MARIPLLLSTAVAMMMASPLASATDNTPAAPAIPAQALNANMLEMAMCGERDQVLAELSTQFKEKPMAVGQVDNNAVVEILVSEAGTWTILATGTDGQSCIVSAGEGFESTQIVRGVDA